MTSSQEKWVPDGAQLKVRGCWYKVSNNKVWRWSNAVGEWLRSTSNIDDLMRKESKWLGDNWRGERG